MRTRRLAFLAWWLGAGAATVACGPKNAAPTRQPLGTDLVSDETGDFELTVEWKPAGDRAVQIHVGMAAVGLDEMDKIVLEVDHDGFELIDGSLEWMGFVPPRQPQSHTVTLQAREDATDPVVNVDVFRSADSKLLFHKEIPFIVSGSSVSPR